MAGNFFVIWRLIADSVYKLVFVDVDSVLSFSLILKHGLTLITLADVLHHEVHIDAEFVAINSVFRV